MAGKTNYPDRIKALRAKLGLTQVQLAERLGVSFATVNRWENGKSKPSQLSWAQIQRLGDHGVGPALPAVHESTAAYDKGAPPPLDFTGKADDVVLYECLTSDARLDVLFKACI